MVGWLRRGRATTACATSLGVACVAAVSLAACSHVRRNEAAYASDFLTRAGFTVLQDQAASDRRLATMPPLRMVKQEKDGRPVYSWADPYACRCVYVGDESAYARYRRLVEEHYLDTITSIPLNE